MAKILLFGGTGHIGRAIAQALCERGHQVTAVVRREQTARPLLKSVAHFITAEVTQPQTLKGICQGYDVVVSALGKSVSPNDWSKPSFEDVDLQANLNIIKEAVESGVGQFMYISAFYSEHFRHLTYFRVHDDFSRMLQNSGLRYAIVQPPAVMSSFLDLADMARRGWLVTIGPGSNRTNPISEGDLAIVCADLIGQPNTIVSAGGQHVYTRHEINEIIQRLSAPKRKVHRVPAWLLRAALPFWKIVNRNMYDKLAFFNEVIHHDLLAPKVGATGLEDYFVKS